MSHIYIPAAGFAGVKVEYAGSMEPGLVIIRPDDQLNSSGYLALDLEEARSLYEQLARILVEVGESESA